MAGCYNRSDINRVCHPIDSITHRETLTCGMGNVGRVKKGNPPVAPPVVV